MAEISALEKLIYSPTYTHISEEETKNLKQAFGMFDKDGSGTIEVEELMDIFLTLDPSMSREEFNDMIKAYDKDGDGTISFDEFRVLMGPAIVQGFCIEQKWDEEVVRAAFNIVDSDHSGRIDATELQTLLEQLGEELSVSDVQLIIDEIDEDGNGEIDFEGFKFLLECLET